MTSEQQPPTVAPEGDGSDGRPRPLNGLGPAALVLPILSALAIGLFATQRHHTEVPPAESVVAPSQVELEAWIAAVPVGGSGARLEVRLTALQGDARRQAFDRDQLAARLGLGAGEPWRLEVRYDAGERSAAGDGETASVRLAGAAISDRDGVASRGLDLAGRGPLAALLRTPPELELQPGEAIQLVLWGRRPNAAPRALGLVQAGAALECMLSPVVVPESDVPASVARLR